MDTKETTTYHAVLSAGLFIGTILFYFIISIIRLQRKQRLLYRTKTEEIILTLEKEKMRVAADLHDDLGPVLSAAKLKLGNIETNSPEDESSKKEAMQHIDSILQQVRYIANDLVPNTLLRKGAVAAIEEYISRTVLSNNLKITFHKTNLHNFPLSSQAHIYRILQEIIHNTVKHAHAKRFHIELRYQKNKLMLGAEMFIKTKPGKGTRYLFHIPLPLIPA